MIELKPYQVRVLESLRDFLRLCSREGRPDIAFRQVTERNGAPEQRYFAVTAEGLDAGMPYVCLRVPTGGGKTLLACHVAGLVITDLLQSENAVVLWLVPSNTILEQTADALRNPRHPYRRALDVACGAVEVVTIEEALRMPRAAVDGQTVVIVSTIQAFRVEDKTGRKVYDLNSAFAEHLLNVPEHLLADLMPDADGKPKPSLVNMLRLRRPVVIVDEAHNARTKLSFATLGGVRPSCIIEFTATPAREGDVSNVLHHVSAAELKAADMVKLPLRVVTRHPSQRDQLLGEAVTLRADLERLAGTEAQATGEYLRPILLVQTDRVADCEPIRDRLVAEFGLPKEWVRISVGSNDELKDVDDIAAPTCQVRVVITVEKLREGWDCPFAYVLCSLRETRSATAIEQIVGRVLRLPNAKEKRHPDLNCAYAFSLSPRIVDVLTELREALEGNGFTAAEASRIILPVPQGTPALGLWQQTVQLTPGTEIDVGRAVAQVGTLQGKVHVDAASGSVTVRVPLSDEEMKKVAGWTLTPEAGERIRGAVEAVRAADEAFGGTGPRMPSPYELGADFIVPKLCVRESPTLFAEFESTHLMDRLWRLSEKDASLSAEYDPRQRPTGQLGRIDVSSAGTVLAEQVSERPENDFVARLHQQVFELGTPSDWSELTLVRWLDEHIEHQDIPYAEAASFLGKAVRGLMAKLGVQDVGVLAIDRFRLRDEVEKRIEAHRRSERLAAFQSWLDLSSDLVVSEEHAINFRTMRYEPSWLYDGGYVFKKHYFGKMPGELAEKTPGGRTTEEFKCAAHIDGLDAVQHWVRNLARRTSSFSLQTVTDRFYPDFVCQLSDGRILVVEYKGADRYTAADAQEKLAVGNVWASRSGGKCLFVMPTAGDFSVIDRAIGG